MKLTLPAAVRTSRTLQVILGAFVTILLGAIGSGLWELLLARLFHAFANVFLSAIASVFHGYVDTLHQGIGKGPYGHFEILPYVILVVIILLSPWITIHLGTLATRRIRRRLLRLTSGGGETVTPVKLQSDVDLLQRILWFMVPVAILTSLLYVSEFIATNYTVRAATFIDRSIEILGPEVDHQTFLRLRAAYRAVDNAEKFYVLEEEIRSIASAHKITLPQFASIRATARPDPRGPKAR